MVWGGQHRGHRQCRRDCGNFDRADKTTHERVNVLAHRPRVADDPASPGKNAFALWRHSDESGATIDQQHAEQTFEVFNVRREGWLTYMARFRRAAEMLLPR